MKPIIKNVFYVILIAIFTLCIMAISTLIFDNMWINFLKDIIVVLVLLLDSTLLMLLY